MGRPRNNSEKFWARTREVKSGCVEWQGNTDIGGYGQFRWNYKLYQAHRVAAFLSGLVKQLNAPTDKSAKEFVLHRCDNRKCCNPKHLFIGNHQDNVQDAISKGAYTQNARTRRGRLTMKQISEIRRRRETERVTYKALADEYNLDAAVIGRIIRKEIYA